MVHRSQDISFEIIPVNDDSMVEDRPRYSQSLTSANTQEIGHSPPALIPVLEDNRLPFKEVELAGFLITVTRHGRLISLLTIPSLLPMDLSLRRERRRGDFIPRGEPVHYRELSICSWSVPLALKGHEHGISGC